MRILINHSNHPHQRWGEEQRMGWDVIIDIPFPVIPADAENHYILAEVEKNMDKVKEIIKRYEKHAIYVYVAGEYTYSYLFVLKMKEQLPISIAIPTSERVVEEKVKEDGSVEKISTFKFIKWRTITLKNISEMNECEVNEYLNDHKHLQ